MRIAITGRWSQFLLTRPSQGVTCFTAVLTLIIEFLLTRPSQGVTEKRWKVKSAIKISTHTPLAGRDSLRYAATDHGKYFYSHAPRRA